jgi:hypothetical protein
MKTIFIITRPHESNKLSEFNEFHKTGFFESKHNYLYWSNDEKAVIILNGEFLAANIKTDKYTVLFKDLINNKIMLSNDIIVLYHSHEPTRFFVADLECEKIPYSSSKGFPIKLDVENFPETQDSEACSTMLFFDNIKRTKLIEINFKNDLSQLYDKISPYCNNKLNSVLNFLHQCLEGKPVNTDCFTSSEFQAKEIAQINETFKKLPKSNLDAQYFTILQELRDALLPMVLAN